MKDLTHVNSLYGFILACKLRPKRLQYLANTLSDTKFHTEQSCSLLITSSEFCDMSVCQKYVSLFEEYNMIRSESMYTGKWCMDQWI